MFILCIDKNTPSAGLRTIKDPKHINKSIQYIKTSYDIDPTEPKLFDNIKEVKNHLNAIEFDIDKVKSSETLKCKLYGKAPPRQKINRKLHYENNKEYYKLKNQEAYKKSITVVLDPDSDDE